MFRIKRKLIFSHPEDILYLIGITFSGDDFALAGTAGKTNRSVMLEEICKGLFVNELLSLSLKKNK